MFKRDFTMQVLLLSIYTPQAVKELNTFPVILFFESVFLVTAVVLGQQSNADRHCSARAHHRATGFDSAFLSSTYIYVYTATMESSHTPCTGFQSSIAPERGRSSAPRRVVMERSRRWFSRPECHFGAGTTVSSCRSSQAPRIGPEGVRKLTLLRLEGFVGYEARGTVGGLGASTRPHSLHKFRAAPTRLGVSPQ